MCGGLGSEAGSVCAQDSLDSIKIAAMCPSALAEVLSLRHFTTSTVVAVNIPAAKQNISHLITYNKQL